MVLYINFTEQHCGCNRHFNLYCFPSSLRNSREREKWKVLLKREGKNRKKWNPCDSDSVCSIHFVDGIPTIANPHPTLHMGYNCTYIKTRRSLYKRFPKSNFSASIGISTDNKMNNYTTKDSTSELFNTSVKSELCNTSELYNTNNDDTIYLPLPSCEHSYARHSLLNMSEGWISTIALFNAIFSLIIPFLPILRYWRGPKHVQIFGKLKRKFHSPKYRKLTHGDEFLLTLMRLCLGILNEDIAERFGISPTTSSNTFTTWMKLLSSVLGSVLIVWLPHEVIRKNLPIFLVGISPNGFITFLSDCYGGRCSDNFITKDSGFYDLLERDDEVMADREFQIQEELLLRFCTLIVPPGARLKSQMMQNAKKNKKIANLRIHVERVINRLKTYRILKNVFP
ncbi:uncharacterized protein LOC124814027 [Hydra vulgaris]|uniref:uncharacterized protein LOC124814027 n=1 Tax=Hydra vulgaris TaxID=6087 RepID=UPI001F5F8BB1|nr:uncharacterized protein LOC124814027 [Hydra vulgaris]